MKNCKKQHEINKKNASGTSPRRLLIIRPVSEVTDLMGDRWRVARLWSFCSRFPALESFLNFMAWTMNAN